MNNNLISENETANKSKNPAPVGNGIPRDYGSGVSKGSAYSGSTESTPILHVLIWFRFGSIG